MKKYLLLTFALLSFGLSFADHLVFIDCQSQADLKSYFTDKDLRINYYSDSFIIATVSDDYQGMFTLLDENCWNGQAYYISWFHKGIKDDYPLQLKGVAEIVLETNDFLFLKANDGSSVHPPKDGRVVRIFNKEISLPEKMFTYKKGQIKNDPEIEAMIAEVDMEIYVQNLQHLQDYGTRNAYTPQSVEAQNWIKEQFESYGYTVELFDFTMPQGPASDNVIATKIGTKYPDEYVVIGGHYDSYSWSGNAPGADDDASGVCGVMEVARVMADWESDRTILFCTWSGEEYGLYGSEAYAQWCQEEGLNILGYFNIDMCGYLHPGDPIHTDMIAPASAQPLVQFYTDACAMYLPDFIVDAGNLTGGDSDHTSFNNAGYMGIFPFEDSQNYSPYIHTSNDVIGTSFNSEEMAAYFTKAMVASVGSMANYLAPPSNLAAFPGDGIIELTWDPLAEIDHYNVYKNNLLLASVTMTGYTDDDVQNFTSYSYYVTAIYAQTGEESNPSNIVTVTPLPPMSFPFSDDFESGSLYWSFEGTWGLSANQSHSPTHSINESPTGSYSNNLEISANLYGFSLENAESAEMSFWAKYYLETDYDYTYLEISTDGFEWSILETFNGISTSWAQKTYSLNSFLGESSVKIRFRFTSDENVTQNGMFVDDFELIVDETGTGAEEILNSLTSVEIYPNPVINSSQVTVKGIGSSAKYVLIDLYSSTGLQVGNYLFVTRKGNISYSFSTEGLYNGIYFCVIKSADAIEVRKLVINK